MSIITITPSGQNITVATTGSNGIVTLTQSDSQVSTLTINQGQQGPAGVSITVDNYGDNRLTTSDGTPGGLYAEDNLTFDGSVLSVSGDLSVSGTLTVNNLNFLDPNISLVLGNITAIGSGNFVGGVYSNGIPVSVSGHTHDVSEISGVPEAVSSGVESYLSSLSGISDVCNTEYVVVQNSINETKLINISDLSSAMSVIDGGGISYTGC